MGFISFPYWVSEMGMKGKRDTKAKQDWTGMLVSRRACKIKADAFLLCTEA